MGIGSILTMIKIMIGFFGLLLGFFLMIIKIIFGIIRLILSLIWNIAGVISEAITETIFYIFGLIGMLVMMVFKKPFNGISNMNSKFAQRRSAYIGNLATPFTSFASLVTTKKSA